MGGKIKKVCVFKQLNINFKSKQGNFRYNEVNIAHAPLRHCSQRGITGIGINKIRRIKKEGSYLKRGLS